MIVLNSFDSVEHLKSKKNIICVISFSSSLSSPFLWIQGKDVTAGSSLNILTWQQVIGKESFQLLSPSLKVHFEERKILKYKNHEFVNYYFYYLHERKMLHLFSQHSLWNRKHMPFLLCKAELEIMDLTLVPWLIIMFRSKNCLTHKWQTLHRLIMLKII